MVRYGRRLLIAATLLASTAACAGKTTARCGERMDGTRTLADGRKAERSVAGEIPGYEMLVPVVDSEEPAIGAICRISDGRELRGIDAFRAGRAATDDPYLLALLAMTVLEAGVAGHEPWRPGAADVPRARAPEWTDAPRRLVYWRRHAQLANWVRVTVDPETGAVEAVLDTALASQQGDLLARSEARLQADTLPERQAAVRELAASDDPAAIALLFEAARANGAWQIRQEAVRRLGERPRPGAVALLASLLASDAAAEVRAAAATALGKLGDPAAREALTQAASDGSSAVRSAANGALAQLR